MGFESGHDFNRYTNLDGVEWRVISALVHSDSKHANNIWKMLAYNEEDCLFKDNLSTKERLALVYRDNGLSTSKKVFLTPYVDDAWNEQASRLDVFVERIIPTNHEIGQVNVGIDSFLSAIHSRH